MAGLFGLFGGKAKYIDEPNDIAVEQNGNNNGNSYFLEPDDAKTLGNIEFMRKPKTIKRSFPKTLNGEGTKVVAQVSSLDKAKINPNGKISPNVSPTPEVKPSSEAPNRRSSDSGMDMFRKMAKDIKK